MYSVSASWVPLSKLENKKKTQISLISLKKQLEAHSIIIPQEGYQIIQINHAEFQTSDKQRQLKSHAVALNNQNEIKRWPFLNKHPVSAFGFWISIIHMLLSILFGSIK